MKIYTELFSLTAVNKMYAKMVAPKATRTFTMYSNANAFEFTENQWNGR